MSARPMIIDTDAGVDDALAILMALADPSVEVVGITTLNGNVSLPNVERNVGTILNAFGAGHIPIYRGAARPLLVDAPDAADIHGADGLGDAGLRAPRDLESTHAALGIIELAKRYPGCTLVTLGPLTNLAIALSLEPNLAQYIGKTIIMGGAPKATGNITATAEFNIYVDPEATALVLSRGNLQPTMVTWENTLDHPILWDRWEALLDAGDMGKRFVRPMCTNLMNWAKTRNRPGMLMADPKAMAVALDPSCATVSHVYIEVDCGTGIGRGMTAVDPIGFSKKPANTYVATHLDIDKVIALITKATAVACHL